MRKTILLTAILLSGIALLAATLEPLNVKTGLWQVTMTNTISGLPKPTINYKSCVKKEDLNKYPFTDPKDKCTWIVQTSTGSKMEGRSTSIFIWRPSTPKTLKGRGNLHLTARGVP
jgi:hypothetical protein